MSITKIFVTCTNQIAKLSLLTTLFGIIIFFLCLFIFVGCDYKEAEKTAFETLRQIELNSPEISYHGNLIKQYSEYKTERDGYCVEQPPEDMFPRINEIYEDFKNEFIYKVDSENKLNYLKVGESGDYNDFIVSLKDRLILFGIDKYSLRLCTYKNFNDNNLHFALICDIAKNGMVVYADANIYQNMKDFEAADVKSWEYIQSWNQKYWYKLRQN